jgi:hypothetical protein
VSAAVAITETPRSFRFIMYSSVIEIPIVSHLFF